MRPFVITGCGRSGTNYIAHVLRRTGLSCGHEDVFTTRSGQVRFSAYDGDASWMAAPHVPNLPGEVVVFHQVRDPERVIRSWVSTGLFARFHLEDNLIKHVGKRLLGAPPSGDHGVRCYIKDRAPQVFSEKTAPARAARYWIEWNSMVANPDLRYRVEDVDRELLGTMLDLIGSPNHDRISEALAATPTDVNKRPSRSDASLGDLPAHLATKVREMAEGYGYSVG